MGFAELIAEAKSERDIGRIVGAIPYAGFLGITADDTYGELIVSLAHSDRNVGNPTLPALHGGVIGAFLETAAILHLLWEQEIVRIPKPITVTVDYLRAAGPRATHARSVVTRLGARVANVRSECWQDHPSRPVAVATANFLVTPADE